MSRSSLSRKQQPAVGSARIKRQLLHDLVEENLDLIEGRAPGRPRRSSRTRPARRLLLASCAVLLATCSLVLSGSADPPRLEPAPPSPRPAISQPLMLAAGEPVADLAGAALDDARLAAAAAGAEVIVPLFLPGAGVPVTVSVVELPAPGRPPSRSTVEGGLLHLEGPIEPIEAVVFPLAVRRIVLDPGHGGDNTGTSIPDGLEEKEITLDVAERLRELLEDDFEVLMTRTRDRGVTLQERADLANRAGADIFVSIHVNWLEGTRESGVETYYLGPTDDPFLTRLAARENRESGHSLGELRRILEGVYAGVRQDTSRELASAVQDSLFRSLRRVNPQLRDRGVKSAPFIVLVDTEMPAILAEVAALSSQTEATMLTKPLYRQYIAEALAEGLREFARAVEDPAVDDPVRVASRKDEQP